MLVMATAALAKVEASRFYPVFRRFQYFMGFPPGIPFFVLC
jgi:hypothetical protein